jgi:hypothetical protein
MYLRLCQACATNERQLAKDEENERREKFLRENPPDAKSKASSFSPGFPTPFPNRPDAKTNVTMGAVKNPATGKTLIKIRMWGTNNLDEPYSLEMDWDLLMASAISSHLNLILEPFREQL